MSSSKIVNDFFKGLGDRLSSSYKLCSFQNTADSRTATNREWLVGDFLNAILPVSTHVRHGAVIVDAFGNQSCDVDLVALQPWASPIWPYAHGIVPVEGVMCAILVEMGWRGSVESFWSQCVSLAELLKSLEKPSGYVVERRRDFHVVRGVWCWEGSLDGVVKNLECHAPNLRDAVLQHSRDAISKGWEGPQPVGPHDPGHKTQEHENCATYHADNDGGVPSWIYVHGNEPSKRFLMLKVEKRDVLRLDKWMPIEDLPDGEIPTKLPYKPVLTDSSHPRWFYALYEYDEEKQVDPLRILAWKLSARSTSFRFERTRYEAYL